MAAEAGVASGTLQAFTESKEVMQMADELPLVACDQCRKESAEERFSSTPATEFLQLDNFVPYFSDIGQISGAATSHGSVSGSVVEFAVH